MQSALYTGRLSHHRYVPTPHAFTYRLCMAWIDLAELDEVFRDRWFWSTRRPALAWLRRSDYLGDADVSPFMPMDLDQDWRFTQPGARLAVHMSNRRAGDEVDFIKRHIFPGSCIPAVSALAQAMAESSDLRIVHLEDIGPHYAMTLARWRDNFFAGIAGVRAMGYPETFNRMWELYLCYCEAGFAEHALGDVQVLLARD